MFLFLLLYWEPLKPSQAGDVGGDGVGGDGVGGDGVGERGTRTHCTATNLTNSGTDKFARAVGDEKYPISCNPG